MEDVVARSDSKSPKSESTENIPETGLKMAPVLSPPPKRKRGRPSKSQLNEIANDPVDDEIVNNNNVINEKDVSSTSLLDSSSNKRGLRHPKKTAILPVQEKIIEIAEPSELNTGEQGSVKTGQKSRDIPHQVQNESSSQILPPETPAVKSQARPPKRGPGRPPNPSKPVVVIREKRGRGRPKKTHESQEDSFVENNDEINKSEASSRQRTPSDAQESFNSSESGIRRSSRQPKRLHVVSYDSDTDFDETPAVSKMTTPSAKKRKAAETKKDYYESESGSDEEQEAPEMRKVTKQQRMVGLPPSSRIKVIDGPQTCPQRTPLTLEELRKQEENERKRLERERAGFE